MDFELTPPEPKPAPKEPTFADKIAKVTVEKLKGMGVPREIIRAALKRP